MYKLSIMAELTLTKKEVGHIVNSLHAEIRSLECNYTLSESNEGLSIDIQKNYEFSSANELLDAIRKIPLEDISLINRNSFFTNLIENLGE